MTNENHDKLKEAYLVAKIHLERMQYAYSKIEHQFPLNIKLYEKISDEDLSFFDQFVFRFSKLQDCMGAKLFKAILDSLGEDTRGIPFIDILFKLEALHIIESADSWLVLREIRNALAHEYPSNQQEVIEGLNSLHAHYQLLLSIWRTVGEFLRSRTEPGI